jgi:hypothetical protein
MWIRCEAKDTHLIFAHIIPPRYGETKRIGDDKLLILQVYLSDRPCYASQIS